MKVKFEANIEIKKRYVVTTILACVFVTALAWAVSTIMVDEDTKASDRAMKASKKIVDMNVRTVGLHNKLKAQTLAQQKQIEDMQKEDLLNRQVECVYMHYIHTGMIYKYPWMTKQHIRNVMLWGRKYRADAPRYEYDTLNPEGLFLVWVSNETQFDPRPDCAYKNAGGSIDWWMMSMNECHVKEKNLKLNLWRRAEKLHPELAKKPDSDPEKNVAVWYLWLNDQHDCERSSCWGIWKRCRPECKELYQAYNAIK